MARSRAAVLGRPIAHSLSPVIHNAGYRAAGLTGWTYAAIEVGEAELAGVVAGLDDRWAGLSLTMPLKRVAVEVADRASPLVTALGAANTLVRADGGWYADNTDAPGMVDALRAAGVTAGPVAVLGAGGTARSALGAAAGLGATDVTVYARREGSVEPLFPVAERLGLRLVAAPWRRVPECAGTATVVISTVPAGAADGLVPALRWHAGMTLLDVVYPCPTPLTAAAAAAGAPVAWGPDLLLAQAARQFELFTGVVPAPVAAMRRALEQAMPQPRPR